MKYQDLIKTLVICSSCPADGRTLVSTNVAFAIAQTGEEKWRKYIWHSHDMLTKLNI